MEAVASPGRRWFGSRATSEQGWCWPRKPQPAGTVPPHCLHADPALVLAALMAFLRRYELIVGIPEACGIPEFYQDAARLETEFNSAPKVDQWGRPVPPSAIDDVVAEPWFLELAPTLDGGFVCQAYVARVAWVVSLGSSRGRVCCGGLGVCCSQHCG